MASKLAQCFIGREVQECEPNVFDCPLCIALRYGTRLTVFVGFALFLYWYWGHVT